MKNMLFTGLHRLQILQTCEKGAFYKVMWKFVTYLVDHAKVLALQLGTLIMIDHFRNSFAQY